MNSPSPYQNRYWKELYQLRVHVYYLEIYMVKTEFLDRAISIFLAVTSSSSICGWAIWNKYSFIWAVIIATSQLVNAIKYFLPYRSRIKTLSNILREIEELLNSFEVQWFDVAEGNLTEEEINKLQFEIRNRKTQILQKHLGINSLPTKYKYFAKAKEMANTYIKNFYGV